MPETQIVHNQDSGDVVVVVRDRYTVRFPFAFIDSELFERLSPAAFKCLAVICRHIDWNDMTTYVSTKTVAARTGMSQRHVRRAYAELVATKFDAGDEGSQTILTKVMHGGGEDSSVYRVNLTPVTPASRGGRHGRHGGRDTGGRAPVTRASRGAVTPASHQLEIFEQEIINKAPPPSPAAATAEPTPPAPTPPAPAAAGEVPLGTFLRQAFRNATLPPSRRDTPGAQAAAAVASSLPAARSSPPTPRHEVLAALDQLAALDRKNAAADADGSPSSPSENMQ